MTKINSKCGKYAVEIIENGRNAEYGYIAMAVMNTFDSETMGNTSYWFGIGHYKTIKNALRAAVKQMAAHNIELDLEGQVA